MTQKIDRRAFLKRTGLLSLLAAGSAANVLSGCTPVSLTEAPIAEEAARVDPTAQPTTIIERPGAPDLEIALKATAGRVALRPGADTAVWKYEAELLKGDPAAITTLPDSYLGPILRVRQGQRIRVHFTNALAEPTIVHWHGLLVPEEMDGHPRDAIAPGETYEYDFSIANRAGTYWFHPHPHGLTGGQVYRGLAGLFLVADEGEDAVGLPRGEYDLPLVIQDRVLDADNQFVYVEQTGQGMMGGAMDQMMGFLGDLILVNGQADFDHPVATRAYRLRLLNGSNSRIYKLGWRDNSPMTVIATDGGLLEKSATRPFVTLAPAERVELWVDFSDLAPGESRFLDSLEFIGAEGDELGGAMGGMGGMMQTSTLRNGASFPVASFTAARQENESDVLPERLSSIERYQETDALNAAKPHQVVLTNRMMAWLLNGRSFEMEGVAPDEIVPVGELQLWEFVNARNPGQMMEQNGMAHSMHIHGTQFQVIKRQVLPDLEAGVASVRDGYVDEGWKDTVLLMPGERVKVLLRFENPGLFLYHCHTLEHEDQGMMRNLQVKA